jgi:hypothetical protein
MTTPRPSAEAQLYIAPGGPLYFLKVPGDWTSAVSMREDARELVRVGTSALQSAWARGDDDADPPDTFRNAVHAALIVLRLSQGLDETATALAEWESQREMSGQAQSALKRAGCA